MTPMFVDSHCHLDRLDLTPYQGDFAQLIRETHEAGVSELLCVSINLERYPAMRKLIEPYPGVSVSVGVHPNEEHCQEPTAEALAALATDSRVVAIGETGLDYFRSAGELEWQRDRFRRHIHAAHMRQLPTIVHTRQARADTLSILKEEQARDVGGVLHCFTEDWATAKSAIEMNFYISLSGILTFKNAADLQEVARKLPMDRILIETDSPYLAPIPKRGKPNYPAYVLHVAECLAMLRGVTLEEVARQTAENYHRLFKRPSFLAEPVGSRSDP